MKAIPSSKVVEVAQLLNVLAMIDNKIEDIKAGDIDAQYDVSVSANGVKTAFMNVKGGELVDVMLKRRQEALSELAKYDINIANEGAKP